MWSRTDAAVTRPPSWHMTHKGWSYRNAARALRQAFVYPRSVLLWSLVRHESMGLVVRRCGGVPTRGRRIVSLDIGIYASASMGLRCGAGRSLLASTDCTSGAYVGNSDRPAISALGFHAIGWCRVRPRLQRVRLGLTIDPAKFPRLSEVSLLPCPNKIRRVDSRYLAASASMASSVELPD